MAFLLLFICLLSEKRVVFGHLTKWNSLIGCDLRTGRDVTLVMCISTNQKR